MQTKPLISVIMPAYNHERYVEAAVRSVLEQDWPRVELIVIDDGSKDKTWEVLCKLRTECEAKLERVVMQTQENCGTCVTLNRLLDLARGEYACWVASDDMLLPGAFVNMLKPMDDPTVGCVVGQNEIMDSEGRTCYWDEQRRCVYSEHEAKYKTFNEIFVHCSGIKENTPEYGAYKSFCRGNHLVNGMLVRMSAYRKVLPYHKEAPLEDLWLHLQMSKFVKYRAVPELTFRYRWHDTNTVKDESHIREMVRKTLRWEQDNLIKTKQWNWLEQFLSVVTKTKVEFSLGPICKFRRVKTYDEKFKILTLLGHDIVFARENMSKRL